jgi:hypothetical protein
MKILVWSVLGLLAALWTAAAWVAAELVGWAAAYVASGAAVELGRSVAQLPVPSWIAPWVDPQWIKAAQDAVLESLEALRAAGDWAGAGLGWLVPGVWVLWGFGVLLMLVLAGAVLVVGRWASGRRAVQGWPPPTRLSS